MNSSLLLKVAIVLGAVIIGIISTYVFKLKKDNPAEEIAEEVIKQETGIDIDLSPESSEKSQPSEKKE